MKYINRNNVTECIIEQQNDVYKLRIYFTNGHYSTAYYNSKDECIKAINKLKLTEL